MKKIEKLTKKEVQTALAELQFNWVASPQNLLIELKTNNFAEAVWVISEVAEAAEELNHHPDLCLKNYNQLTISLSTHSVQGLTKKDFVLAKKIEGFVTRIKN